MGHPLSLSANSGFGKKLSEWTVINLNYMFFLPGRFRSARYVVMKLPAKYPYKDVYENCLA
jgi:hypothetical protein